MIGTIVYSPSLPLVVEKRDELFHDERCFGFAREFNTATIPP